MKAGKNRRLYLGYTQIFVLNFSDHFTYKKKYAAQIAGHQICVCVCVCVLNCPFQNMFIISIIFFVFTFNPCEHRETATVPRPLKGTL